jgi:nucleoside-diphosphate-sugar epimerase
MNVLITGSNGFVGKHLSDVLLSKSYYCTLSQRKAYVGPPLINNSTYIKKTISEETSWHKELQNIDYIVHCAALVHQKTGLSEASYREINTDGTITLAKQAAIAGVKRFIFISSIKVNGNLTEVDSPFQADDNNIPTDAYALSKYEAELGLRKIADKTDMEVVIIRPPLIYGPSVKANFYSMMKWVNNGIPLPFGRIKDNKRSLVSLDNLVDLIITCIEHPNAANQTFLVSDNNDISTFQLLTDIASALDVPLRLLPIPSTWLTLIARLIGKPAISDNLCGSLQVNISKTQELLNWQPTHLSNESMKKTATAFLDSSRK